MKKSCCDKNEINLNDSSDSIIISQNETYNSYDEYCTDGYNDGRVIENESNFCDSDGSNDSAFFETESEEESV